MPTRHRCYSTGWCRCPTLTTRGATACCCRPRASMARTTPSSSHSALSCSSAGAESRRHPAPTSPLPRPYLAASHTTSRTAIATLLVTRPVTTPRAESGATTPCSRVRGARPGATPGATPRGAPRRGTRRTLTARATRPPPAIRAPRTDPARAAGPRQSPRTRGAMCSCTVGGRWGRPP